MQPHEPISVFQKPKPKAEPRPSWLSTAQRRRLSCTLAAFSAAVLIVLLAADVAGAAVYCFKNGF